MPDTNSGKKQEGESVLAWSLAGESSRDSEMGIGLECGIDLEWETGLEWKNGLEWEIGLE